jgi:hypothetical protein
MSKVQNGLTPSAAANDRRCTAFSPVESDDTTTETPNGDPQLSAVLHWELRTGNWKLAAKPRLVLDSARVPV